MKTLIQSYILFYVIFNFQFAAKAQIIEVPGDYAAIQIAINNSQDGDTVLVSEGTYYENINFKGKGIVVCSKYALNNGNDFLSFI